MKTTLSSGRLLLDETTSKNVAVMMATLREEGGSHIRLHPSKVVCWMLNCFFEKYFERERKRMLEAHTDKKATLMSLIKNLTESEEAAYLEAMVRLSKQKGGISNIQPPQQVASEENEK